MTSILHLFFFVNFFPVKLKRRKNSKGRGGNRKMRGRRRGKGDTPLLKVSLKGSVL